MHIAEAADVDGSDCCADDVGAEVALVEEDERGNPAHLLFVG